MVKDKINYRALGPRTALTRQPVSGRANDGGLRIGEMERDVVISHGATNFLTESMMERGDKYYMAVCNKTGMVAIYNPSKNLFMSPGADGPIQFTGSLDGKSLNIENITRFGRSFSVIGIPYSMKLMIQELQAASTQMRIITEDNIEQIENMSYSRNIEKLTMKPGMTFSDVHSDVKILIYNQAKVLKTPESVDEGVVDKQMAVFDRLSPEPPPYAPASPAYAPNSPAYQPNSPPYAPDSPPYATGSPTYHPEYPGVDPSDELPVRSTDSSPFSFTKTYGQDSPQYAANNSDDSPPFAPTTPTDSPAGGSEYNLGDIVYLRGGKKANSPYQIIKKGNKFLTVKSMDSSNYEDDPIQVVMPPFEILLPHEINHAAPTVNPFQAPMIKHNYVEEPSQAFPQKDGIVFAPVIRIVNGNDNSTNDGQPSGNETMHGGEPFSTPVINNMSGGNATPAKIENVAADPLPVQEASFGSGIIDFAKSFIIKKTG